MAAQEPDPAHWPPRNGAWDVMVNAFNWYETPSTGGCDVTKHAVPGVTYGRRWNN